ncbi:hypothetical protein EG68_11267 [Paragonimus skrjabini miyazakii]|uniref:Uncharacterized protein n=1 Tax=Paragonimus skrjabini miyazakii TaxID=59628 RepID=A0A8S9YE12_9TREM|nr:hypothetical protein EG68_11267 [Paragonimus skrjabini miyazakii]
MHPKDQRTTEWSNGPEFLWKDQVEWPVQPEDLSDRLTDLRPKVPTQVVTTMGSSSWFDCFSRSCSLSRLLRRIACLHQFCGYVSPSYARRHHYATPDDSFSVKAIKDAEVRVL